MTRYVLCLKNIQERVNNNDTSINMSLMIADARWYLHVTLNVNVTIPFVFFQQLILRNTKIHFLLFSQTLLNIKDSRPLNENMSPMQFQSQYIPRKYKIYWFCKLKSFYIQMEITFIPLKQYKFIIAHKSHTNEECLYL